jgi:hypothetical protein
MALFGFLKTEKPGGFTYRPRFYDEKKEAFQERLKKAKEMSEDNPEALKSRIRHSFQRKGGYVADRHYRSQRVMRSNLLLLFIIVLLVLVLYVAIEVYLPHLVKMFE